MSAQQEQLLLQLSALEHERDEKRREYEQLFDKIAQLRKNQETLESHLFQLDESIQQLNDALSSTQTQTQTQDTSMVALNQLPVKEESLKVDANEEKYEVKNEPESIQNKSQHVEQKQSTNLHLQNGITQTQADEILNTQEVTNMNIDIAHARNANPYACNGGNRFGQVNTTNSVKTRTLDSFIIKNSNDSNEKQSNDLEANVIAKPYTAFTSAEMPTNASDLSTKNPFPNNQKRQNQQQITAPVHTSNNSASMLPKNLLLHRPSAEERSAEYIRRLALDNFPWSKHLLHLIQNVFRIKNFRENQKEVINCTMNGKDALLHTTPFCFLLTQLFWIYLRR